LFCIMSSLYIFLCFVMASTNLSWTALCLYVMYSML
jgi:hypothetical protein